MTEAATNEETKDLTFRRYQDGETGHVPWNEDVVHAGESHKCPTYVQRTPPCQGSCPSGHDIRGWLDIVRGMDKPVGDKPWQEYAFERMVEANPFPAIMGRVCPAPCQDGCNRNEVDEHVGINSVEQFIGDWALQHNLKLPPAAPDSGKKVAIIGGGPAGLAAAYFLRRKGHACTIFEEYSGLGGMMLFGIPGYRTPRDVLEGEGRRIIAAKTGNLFTGGRRGELNGGLIALVGLLTRRRKGTRWYLQQSLKFTFVPIKINEFTARILDYQARFQELAQPFRIP